ncbi:MAG TPA: hypothetical protein VL326_05215 [Kofleriaceae bacterium]|nr:hypothetical protein [Kofleriaceae bacterium]
MRRLVLIAAMAGCGSDDAMTVHTSFVVTSVQGSNPSPLDPLANQTIDFTVTWAGVESLSGAGSDPAGCKTTTLYGPTTRVASGSMATLVQTEILDRLNDWDVRFQLCDAGAGKSSLAVDASINELNTAFGCFGIPASAERRAGDGYPQVTTFTATDCSSTILDVVNVKELSNPSFSLSITTGPDALP